MKLIVKGFLLSVLLFILSLIIISVISIWIDIQDGVYSLLRELISVVPLVLVSFEIARINKKNGAIKGLILGILFCVFLFIINSILDGGITIRSISNVKYIIYLVLSIISGIMSVNF